MSSFLVTQKKDNETDNLLYESTHLQFENKWLNVSGTNWEFVKYSGLLKRNI